MEQEQGAKEEKEPVEENIETPQEEESREEESNHNLTPILIENPFLVAAIKRLRISTFATLCLSILNTLLLLIIFAVNQGNQTQIYNESKVQQQAQTEVLLEAVKEETKAAVEEAGSQNQKQSEATIRQLQKLTNAAQQPKVVKK